MPKMRPVVYPQTFLRRRSAVHRDIEQLLRLIRERASVGLHLGAAGSRIPGLINCDLFDPNADRKVDATDLSSFEDGSVDLIEHHHMMEHLSFVQADRALMEWARVLKPGRVSGHHLPGLVTRLLAISQEPRPGPDQTKRGSDRVYDQNDGRLSGARGHVSQESL